MYPIIRIYNEPYRGMVWYGMVGTLIISISNIASIITFTLPISDNSKNIYRVASRYKLLNYYIIKNVILT